MADKVELEEMTRGDAARYQFTITKDGSPVNLTGSKVWFTGKRTYADADVDAVFRKTSDPGGGIDFGVDPTAGVATVTLAPEDTQELPPYRVILVWDLQFKPAAGNPETPLSGSLPITPDVTRSTT